MGIDIVFDIEFEYRYNMVHSGPSVDHHIKFGLRELITNFRVDRQIQALPRRRKTREQIMTQRFLTEFPWKEIAYNFQNSSNKSTRDQI